MAGKKGQKKTQKRVARRTGLKTGGKKLYKAVKAIAKNEAEKLMETKYKTSQITFVGGSDFVQPLLTSKFSLSPSNTNVLIPVIPSINRGLQSNEMIGSRILLTSGKTDFHFTIDANTIYSVNCIVKLFCLESRKVRDYNEMGQIPDDALIRLGDDTTINWDNSLLDPIKLDMFPINKASFKVHHIKEFRFNKNVGRQNGEADSFPTETPAYRVSPNNGVSQHSFTWHWGSEKKLKYDDNPLNAEGAEFPTNFAPIWGAVLYCPDGNDYLPSVRVRVVNHMYYKDA